MQQSRSKYTRANQGCWQPDVETANRRAPWSSSPAPAARSFTAESFYIETDIFEVVDDRYLLPDAISGRYSSNSTSFLPLPKGGVLEAEELIYSPMNQRPADYSGHCRNIYPTRSGVSISPQTLFGFSPGKNRSLVLRILSLCCLTPP